MPTLDKGWMPGIERIQTVEGSYGGLIPNGSLKAIAVMSHIMQGYQATMIRWAQGNPLVQKSAHFTIGRSGRTVQHASIYDMTWAAGRHAGGTWGLLPANHGTQSINRLVVNIEHEGFSERPRSYPADYIYDAGHPWPVKMVQASIEVQFWILKQLSLTPDFNTLIGHRDTDARTRANDPGAQWPQRDIVRKLQEMLIPGVVLNPRPGTPPDADPNTNTTIVVSAEDMGNMRTAINDNGLGIVALREGLDAHETWHRTVG